MLLHVCITKPGVLPDPTIHDHMHTSSPDRENQISIGISDIKDCWYQLCIVDY